MIELIISAAVGALILVGAYACLTAGVSSQRLIEPRSEVLQKARVAMAILSADLRNACPLSTESQFVGIQRELEGELEGLVAAGNLDFATHNYTPRRPREADYCQLSYFVAKSRKPTVFKQESGVVEQKSSQSETNNTESGSLEMGRNTGPFSLWRRRNPMIAADAFTGGTREEILSGIRGVRFEFYDGYEWYDTWGETDKDRKAKNETKKDVNASNLDGMPEAVRITLYLDPDPKARKTEIIDEPPMPAADSTNIVIRPTQEPPLIFQTVTRLELAANYPSSSTGSTLSSSSADSPASSTDSSATSPRQRRGSRNGGNY